MTQPAYKLSDASLAKLADDEDHALYDEANEEIERRRNARQTHADTSSLQDRLPVEYFAS